MVKRSINEFAIRLGKPFHDKNFLISLSSVLILLGVQILCTRSISANFVRSADSVYAVNQC